MPARPMARWRAGQPHVARARPRPAAPAPARSPRPGHGDQDTEAGLGLGSGCKVRPAVERMGPTTTAARGQALHSHAAVRTLLHACPPSSVHSLAHSFLLFPMLPPPSPPGVCQFAVLRTRPPHMWVLQTPGVAQRPGWLSGRSRTLPFPTARPAASKPDCHGLSSNQTP